MIQPSIFNAVNFSNDFNRESKLFDPFLQRKRNIIATASDSYLSFYFKPDTVPEIAPTATLKIYFGDIKDDFFSSISSAMETAITGGWLYFFSLYNPYASEVKISYVLTIDGYDDIIYSEECDFVLSDNLTDYNIIKLKAYNDDDTHGYISDYPACGFFKVSELNCDIFGNEKTEYEYSYGRKKILSSENYIKKRYTFVDLTMYQQNLLKALCNCENLTINGTLYYLVSDFAEVGKDVNNEICSLQADFLPVSQSFFATGASEAPSKLTPENLFIN